MFKVLSFDCMIYYVQYYIVDDLYWIAFAIKCMNLRPFIELKSRQEVFC